MIHSLQYRLSLWLAACIIIVTLGGVAMSFALAFHEANEFQDDQLRQVAALVESINLRHTPRSISDVLVGDDDTRIVVQVLHTDLAGEETDQGEHALALPPNLADGVQTISVGDMNWRVFIKSLRGDIRIAVSQPTSVRNEIAEDSALRTLVPLILLLTILPILVGIITQKMFKQVKALALHIDKSQEQDLTQLEEEALPQEIKPFVAAINRLLSRVEHSVAVQRRFITDAAHELRSPLTALSLQAERLSEADMSKEATERVITLRKGITRSQALINQLLALARIEERHQASDKPVSLQRVIHLVLEDLILQAQLKEIDLGVASELDIEVTGDETELIMLVKNMIDNAIRHTPKNGRIDITLAAINEQATLTITDTGPGIREEDRHRVFDAFFRVPGNDQAGSGLGLSIVKAAADHIAASVELSHTQAAPPYGLCITVKFKHFNLRCAAKS